MAMKEDTEGWKLKHNYVEKGGDKKSKEEERK